MSNAERVRLILTAYISLGDLKASFEAPGTASPRTDLSKSELAAYSNIHCAYELMQPLYDSICATSNPHTDESVDQSIAR